MRLRHIAILCGVLASAVAGVAQSSAAQSENNKGNHFGWEKGKGNGNGQSGAAANPAPAPLLGLGIPAAGGTLLALYLLRRFRRRGG